jgi:hypothetical protein
MSKELAVCATNFPILKPTCMWAVWGVDPLAGTVAAAVNPITARQQMTEIASTRLSIFPLLGMGVSN